MFIFVRVLKKTHTMNHADIIVAGQICLDIILLFENDTSNLNNLFVPGKCTTIGDTVFATGGCVANTGQALHQLGIPTRLISKIGKDQFGEAILNILRQNDERLTEGIIVKEDIPTSFAVVITPPETDRSFMYHPGANNTFVAADVPLDDLADARFFHFGYPPEMQKMYANNGKELVQLMKAVKKKGLTTSMDTANPDSNPDVRSADWRTILENVLPDVDIFLPSFDEVLFMLDKSRFKDLWQNKELAVNVDLLKEIAEELLAMGTAIVVLKLGDAGLYMQTTSDRNRMKAIGKGCPSNIDAWLNLRLAVPPFKATVVSTTGAGDSSIAGFLAGFSKDLLPFEVLKMASAVGGFSVEHAAASTGVPHWEVVRKRVEAGWLPLKDGLILD